MNSIITLTTDFQDQDYFVGAMKGVILNINPDAQIIDITHQVPPHDILDAAFVLLNACLHFPKDTIHIAVVDPRVGGERKPIILQTDRYSFVGPDNGIFSLVLEDFQKKDAYEISNPDLTLPDVSDTFHGRDIFAPAAAHLSKGVSPPQFGPRLSQIVQLPIPEPTIFQDVLTCHVIHIDAFGNLVTDISKDKFDAFTSNHPFRILAGQHSINSISHSYAEAARPPQGGKQKPLAIFGSAVLLEISITDGNAHKILNIKRGDLIKIKRGR